MPQLFLADSPLDVAAIRWPRAESGERHPLERQVAGDLHDILVDQSGNRLEKYFGIMDAGQISSAWHRAWMCPPASAEWFPGPLQASGRALLQPWMIGTVSWKNGQILGSPIPDFNVAAAPARKKDMAIHSIGTCNPLVARSLDWRFMVSLSNHEARRTDRRAEPSWFDKLTMKATLPAAPRRTATPGAGRRARPRRRPGLRRHCRPGSTDRPASASRERRARR